MLFLRLDDIIKTEHMFEHLRGVVILSNKEKIVECFIEEIETVIMSEKSINITFLSNGISMCFSVAIDNIYISEQVISIELRKGDMYIRLREYNVKLIDSEGVLTLQLKNESNEIRISI